MHLLIPSWLAAMHLLIPSWLAAMVVACADMKTLQSGVSVKVIQNGRCNSSHFMSHLAFERQIGKNNQDSMEHLKFQVVSYEIGTCLCESCLNTPENT